MVVFKYGKFGLFDIFGRCFFFIMLFNFWWIFFCILGFRVKYVSVYSMYVEVVFRFVLKILFMVKIMWFLDIGNDFLGFLVWDLCMVLIKVLVRLCVM